MASLSRSARSTGPLVVLVAFSLIFATAWEHDHPRPRLPVSARRESTHPGQHADSDIAPVKPLADRTWTRSASGIRNGLAGVADICERRHKTAAARIVGGQLSSRLRTARRQRPCFSGPAAFLCGTLHNGETPRSAARDHETDWALE